MSNNPSNLDLSDVQSEDHSKLVDKINSFYTADASAKSQMSYHWERNHLMLDGRQWIVYSGDRQWQKLKVQKANEYIPRPVTNYMWSAYQTLKSYVIKDKPRSSIWPNTQLNKDKTAAKIGKLCLEANWERLKEQANYEVAACNLVTYGTVFKKDYWDVSSLTMVRVPKMTQVPINDPMTGQPVGSTDKPELDPVTGEQLYEELPLGDVNTCIVEPFRMTLDPLALNLHEAKWLMECSVQPLSWIVETYSREEPGYTGLADKVKEDKTLNTSLERWYKLRTSSGLKGMTGGTDSGSAGDGMVENSAVVKEYYEAPSKNYPKGRMVVVAGDQCLYADRSPYEGPEKGDWHPYSECRWELVPGRYWGKSPLDEIAEINKQINSIDSVMILIRKTCAIPQKLIPMGCGIALLNIKELIIKVLQQS